MKRRLKLFSTANHRTNDSVCSDIEGSLNKAPLRFWNADKRCSFSTLNSSNVVSDLVPIELTVFHLDHDPINAGSTERLGHTRAFERNPNAIGGLALLKFLSERIDSHFS